MKKSIIILSVAMTLFGVACSDLLDAPDRNAVEAENHYTGFNDADKAIMGIYGKLMSLADRVVILNELRADLMDITENATADMTAINNHTATADNKYCDLAPFYEVILNCNDALANFEKMKAENKLSDADFVYRYSDVAAVRCWVYLQLAIHFGNVPYITTPLITLSDLNDDSNFPVKNFDQLLQELINCMTSLPSLELSTASPLYGSFDGYNMSICLLNKKMVLGDLYLWTNRYVEAARQYYSVISEAEIKLFSGNEQNAYKVDGWVWNNTNEPRFQVTYARYKSTDLNSFRNKWKEIFSRQSTDSELGREMINMFSYDASFAPQYPFIELFANTGKGKYMLKPSDWAINELWEKQVQRENNFVFDGRGRQSSFDHVNGQPVVIKYLYDYYPQIVDDNRTIHLQYHLANESTIQRGKWFIYRAGLLHLRYAEAVNRAGYPDLAYALLNNGISENYSWPNEDGTSRSNREGIQYSGYRPVSDEAYSVPYPEPFYLDARQSDPPYAYIRAPWRNHYGLRQRAFVQNVPKPDWVFNKSDSIQWIEKALLNEAALELGFEGHRWSDILRIAMRKNRDDGTGTFLLNELLRNKFERAGGTTPNITPNNWFLPRKY